MFEARVNVYSPLSHQCKDDLTSLFKHLKMWTSVINPSYIVFFFCKFMVLTKAKNFQEKKRWSPCLSEAQCAIWNRPCLLLYRICLFSTLLWCVFVEAFKPERHIGIQPCPSRFQPMPELGPHFIFWFPEPGTIDFRYLQNVNTQKSLMYNNSSREVLHPEETLEMMVRWKEPFSGMAWTWLRALQCQWHFSLPLWACLCTSNAGDCPSQGGGLEKNVYKACGTQ